MFAGLRQALVLWSSECYFR